VIPLHESLDQVETQLASASLDPGRRAELRHLLGSLYEDLAADAKDQGAPAPEAAPSRPAKPAPVEAPQRQERPAEAPPVVRESPPPPVRPARAEKRKPAPPPVAEDENETEEEPSYEENMRRQKEDMEKASGRCWRTTDVSGVLKKKFFVPGASPLAKRNRRPPTGGPMGRGGNNISTSTGLEARDFRNLRFRKLRVFQQPARS
jgi:hypothetical protein